MIYVFMHAPIHLFIGAFTYVGIASNNHACVHELFYWFFHLFRSLATHSVYHAFLPSLVHSVRIRFC